MTEQVWHEGDLCGMRGCAERIVLCTCGQDPERPDHLICLGCGEDAGACDCTPACGDVRPRFGWPTCDLPPEHVDTPGSRHRHETYYQSPVHPHTDVWTWPGPIPAPEYVDPDPPLDP